ncbi:11363_t:CDS:1 [Funneliformis mosseae]|uniref:11363_t:CDS:1 n=1 Tax=Funneliformis mosseae TaxID=27381 RepID=A0A9N9BKG2_FUNMO|nr:11363_t:CDS:1 [Funneliformis mosseae]
MERLRNTYIDKVTHQLQLDNGIKQRIFLHVEMNILASIIDEKNMNRQFIAVSKSCCYLCELYIDFARKRGYKVIISETYKKLYDGWKLPHVVNNNFKNESLKHLLENLNLIIENKIKRYTRSLLADSDSTANSVNDNANNDDSDQNCLLEKF